MTELWIVLAEHLVRFNLGIVDCLMTVSVDDFFQIHNFVSCFYTLCFLSRSEIGLLGYLKLLEVE